MADEPDNLVLVLLRELRGEFAEMRRDIADLKVGQAEHTRELSDLREAVSSMIGYTHQVALKQTRIDRDLISLHNRVTAIEVTLGSGAGQ